MKVIVSSADIQDGTAAKARALGASAFVPKPVDAEELRRVIRVVLAQSMVPAALPIDPRYVDAFREIFNIGIGRAASALSIEPPKLPTPALKAVSCCASAAVDCPVAEGVDADTAESPSEPAEPLPAPGFGLQAMKNDVDASRIESRAIRLSMVRSESTEMPRVARSEPTSFHD